MIKDIIFIGAIIGFLSDVVKLVSNFIMFQLGFTNVVFWQIVATRFLERKDLFKPATLLIGAVADITVSSVLGVVFVFLIYLSGRKYLYIKGIVYGLFIWVSIFGTLLGQSVQEKLPQNPSSIIVTITAHFVFGISMAFFTGLISRYFDVDYSPAIIGTRKTNFPLKAPTFKPLSKQVNSTNIKKFRKPIKLKHKDD